MPTCGAILRRLTNLATILDVYSLEDILELNDLTTEDCLSFLVENEFVTLPTITPLEFDD